MLKKYSVLLFIVVATLTGCNNDEQTNKDLRLLQAFIGSTELNTSGTSITENLPTDRSITLNFSTPLNRTSAANAVTLSNADGIVSTSVSFSAQDKSLIVFPGASLEEGTLYTVTISSELQGVTGESFTGIQFGFRTIRSELRLVSFRIDNTEYINTASTIRDVAVHPSITLIFSSYIGLNPDDHSIITIKDINGVTVPVSYTIIPEATRQIDVSVSTKLKSLMKYELTITNKIVDEDGHAFTPVVKTFYTGIDPDPVFALLPNDEDNDNDNTNDLLSVVQKQTFKYFWDFAHPVSGMARERNTSGDVVTSGGSGFGIMALVVGMERNFITRSEGIERMKKIVTFLENADRFHGAWSHWINGVTGEVIPFSEKDNGGDLVETSFLVQGLLTFRQYLDAGVSEESMLINRITALWEAVEWDWYRKNNADVLYWHWSPTYNWNMNFPLYGYFEEQITYFLAASSPTHGIPRSVYTAGYGDNGSIVTNNTYYGYTLPLQSPGPLFWVQYSYLGLDPHFNDDYANYWTQNVNASLINQAYCIANPKGYIGYSDQCWGLTASDNQNGYDAHSPSNDKGVITPTAALSSFPYAPQESMKALKFFYYKLGDRLWGDYGFYDAFNLTDGWTANSYLAIDQGPVIVMIENYRTGLLWELFKSAPEVQNGKTVLGFTN